AEFYFQWLQNIPEVMKPNTETERKDFVDLIYRAMFYISLEDEFLQKALSDLKDPNPNIKTYFDEACAAESRRQSFQDITQSSTCLDSKGVNIAKWDIPFNNKKKFSNRSDNKTGTSQGVKAKADVSTHGNDAKGGNKGQKQQNFSDQKSKQTQNSKQNNSDQNKAIMKWCDFHKHNKSHTSKDCFKLKSKTKSVKKLDEAKDDSDQTEGPEFYGSFHSIEAVNPNMPVVKSFASVNDAHPLATSEPLMTYLNV
ncbi:MAG: hypothetical protein GY793_08225, partial [Proteobacteria bacterium]|nr:hypothetical protein [Pseudomonadota bacterium]